LTFRHYLQLGNFPLDGTTWYHALQPVMKSHGDHCRPSNVSVTPAHHICFDSVGKHSSEKSLPHRTSPHTSDHNSHRTPSQGSIHTPPRRMQCYHSNSLRVSIRRAFYQRVSQQAASPLRAMPRLTTLTCIRICAGLPSLRLKVQ
jgi:hypothetical protein